MASISAAISAIAAFGLDRGVRDDDVIDRLNHVFMYGLLVLVAVGSGAKQFVGSPIVCWTPAEFSSKQYRQYINNHCWVHSLYNTPFDEPIAPRENDRWLNDVSYYRWVTIIFLAQASMFRGPQLLWKELKALSGANLEKITNMTLETALMGEGERAKHLSHVAEFIHRWITSRSKFSRKGSPGHRRWRLSNFYLGCGKRSGRSLVLTYLLVKGIYLFNVIGQIFILSRFLKVNYWSFGVDALASYYSNGSWEDIQNFPRIGLCDLKIRQQTNVNTFTVQCVLSVNLFLEKAFLLLWFCLIFLLISNAASLAKWTYQFLNETKTAQFLMKYSGVIISDDLSSREEVKEFWDMARRYLKPDGIFLVRMVSLNASDLLVIDLLRQIWKRYKKFRLVNSQGRSEGEAKLNGEIKKKFIDKKNEL